MTWEGPLVEQKKNERGRGREKERGGGRETVSKICMCVFERKRENE